MSGRARPLTCCDPECAEVNGCVVGGYQCDGCGLWFCGDDVEETADGILCEKCARSRAEDEEDE